MMVSSETLQAINTTVLAFSAPIAVYCPYQYTFRGRMGDVPQDSEDIHIYRHLLAAHQDLKVRVLS